MNTQLHHNNTEFVKKHFPITILCDRVNSPANIGSIFRVADSFGVEQILFCGKNLTIISKRMIRTARSTHQIVPHQIHENSVNTLKTLKENGYYIVALEITQNSTPIQQLRLPKLSKIALIIGEENFGIAEDLLQLADCITHINMYGNNSSMNVATATGIALYELTNQLT
ncbi:TrmH family RNA methyltransferase [Aquimarina brevivitae]|uniref:SpoU rRNA methylase family protein n=1 Tax=Aquimarina brevivitae TaxID=323412 RepID=A0A4Q7NWH3_9FLAO|nr:TrmH family RNA methyltransferase [Aquimarina brevivitae]RZS90752.1 SpoU rRNA methylase family protein [Aquimarina brevivitae]